MTARPAAQVAGLLRDWPAPTDLEQIALPRAFQRGTGPLQRRAGYDRFSACLNCDNHLDTGTARVRGIYAQENHAAVPVFRAWRARAARRMVISP